MRPFSSRHRLPRFRGGLFHHLKSCLHSRPRSCISPKSFDLEQIEDISARLIPGAQKGRNVGMNDTEVKTITIEGTRYTYPTGTAFAQIAADLRSRYDGDILLAELDGEVFELRDILEQDGALRLLTAKDRAWMQAYRRGLIFLTIKAFYDTAGMDQVERLTVEHAVDEAMFIRAQGSFTLDGSLLGQVEARMRELAALALPIEKRTMNAADAIALFRRQGMQDQAELLRSSIAPQVSVYFLDGFGGCFDGCMVPDTGCLGCFALQSFADGFVLRFPSRRDPSVLGGFSPSRKTFQELREAAKRHSILHVSSAGDMNKVVASGNATQMILSQEAMMEKKIGDIAEEIAGRKKILFVMIAGPSSSGKTTFSQRLSTQLIACGMRPHAIATDNYFKDLKDTPKDENGQYDFEGLGAMDVEQFNRDMARLLQGETVEIPSFNFKKCQREYNGDFLTLGPQDVLVIEGIHCLNDALSYSLPKESRYRIFISCLTTLNIDDHNCISTTDARLLRRIERDARTRGHSAQATLEQWPSVLKGEACNILPYQDSADTVFSSAMIYELPILKPYVEPLLFGVPKGSEAYGESRRLLKLLSHFLPIPADDVPKTSLLREFIGGGCYKS